MKNKALAKVLRLAILSIFIFSFTLLLAEINSLPRVAYASEEQNGQAIIPSSSSSGQTSDIQFGPTSTTSADSCNRESLTEANVLVDGTSSDTPLSTKPLDVSRGGSSTAMSTSEAQQDEVVNTAISALATDDSQPQAEGYERLFGDALNRMVQGGVDPSGTVTNWTGSSIYYATVSASQEGQVVVSTQTDEGGNYSLVVTDGTYELTAARGDYVDQAKTIDVIEPMTVNFSDMVYRGCIYGLVTDADGNPLEGATAAIRLASNGQNWGQTTTGADGRYMSWSFFVESPFNEADFNLEITATGYELQTASNVHVTADSATRCDFQMLAETVLKGTVTGQSNGAVLGARVVLSYTDTSGNYNEHPTVADETGFYRISRIRESVDGTYNLHVEHPEYLNYDAAITNLTLHAVNTVDVAMTQQPGIIQVTVTDSASQPIVGAKVVAELSGYHIEKITDASGSVTIHVADGDWTVSAEANGYVKGTAQVAVTGGSTQTVALALIQMGLPVTLGGYVTDVSNGAALPDSDVWFVILLNVWPWQVSVWTTTDSNGYYKLDTGKNSNFTSGVFGSLGVWHEGYKDYDFDMVIPEGTTTKNITLIPFAGSITINAYDTAGFPVAGVSVYIQGWDSREKISNANGQVVFERCGPLSLEEGGWYLYIGDYTYERYYDWTMENLTLADGEQRVINATLVSTSVPVRFQGYVTDSFGSPISGALVKISLVNYEWSHVWNYTQYNKTETNGAGYFDCTLHYSANLYRLEISRSGYYTATFDVRPQELPALNLAYSLELISFTQPVSGTIRDFFDSPIEGIEVSILRGGSVYRMTSTDSYGFYSFDLPGGSYTLSVASAGYIAQSRDFTVELDGSYSFDFILLKNRSLYGRIYGFSGTYVERATVMVMQNGSAVTTTTSKTNGLYQTDSVPEGDYNVKVEALYYEITTLPVTIVDGSALNQNFSLAPAASCGLYGYVTDKTTGLAISGATISLYLSESPEPEQSVTTDQGGYYIISNLLPGDQWLSFSATGYLDDWGYVWLEVAQSLEFDKSLELIALCSISGTVTCWAGPVASATVRLDGALTTITSQNSEWQFTGVNMGSHQLTAEKDGVTASDWVWLANGENRTGVEIRLPARILETDPPGGALLNQVDLVKARVFGARPGAPVDMYLVGNHAWFPSGYVAIQDDWVMFIPDAPLLGPAEYSVRVTTSEFDTWYEFYVYPRTDNPPRITWVNPQENATLRRVDSFTVTVNVNIDAGNFPISQYAIYVDSNALPTSLGGSFDGWTLIATSSALSHGWHILRAVAVDGNGRSTERSWQIFYSANVTPLITNLITSPAFSPNGDGITDVMNITASISEPIHNARMVFTNIPNVDPVALGYFPDEIQTSWNGWVHDPGLRDYYTWQWIRLPSDFIPPDREVLFYLTGSGGDGKDFNSVYAAILIDRQGPSISPDSQYIYTIESFTKSGLLFDLTGISSFNVSVYGGAAAPPLWSQTSFSVNLNFTSDGAYTIDYTATDNVGNRRSVSQQIFVDKIAPTASIIAPDAGSEVRPAQRLVFSLSDGTSGFNLNSADIEVLLDGSPITSAVFYSGYQYSYYGALVSVNGAYEPHYLNDGAHLFEVRAKDRAANLAQASVSFSSVTKPPEVSEKSIDMAVGPTKQTILFRANAQENSDRGWASFSIILDGSAIPEGPSYTPLPGTPYAGTLLCVITRDFSSGPHSIVLTATDGLGLSATLSTGFYYDRRVGVPQAFSESTLYINDVSWAVGEHSHMVEDFMDYRFKPGSRAIWGYCQIHPPPYVYTDPRLPMGGQRAFTTATSDFVDASGTTHVSLWMTNIVDYHQSYWGWGEAIYVVFDDGTQELPDVYGDFNIAGPKALYAHHEPPWANAAGLIDNYKETAIGNDGRVWKRYEAKIPDGFDKSHLRVKIVWEAINWNSWGWYYYNRIYSYVDGIEFFTPFVVTTDPIDGAQEVPLSLTVSALFRLPMDPTSFTSETFYLQDRSGNKIGTTTSYSGGWGSLKPTRKLDGSTTYIGVVTPDVRTVYGRILPRPPNFTWSFKTREGESTAWQTIYYNGEEYGVYLIWGPGYNGEKPHYLSPAALPSAYGASLVGIDVIKHTGGKYYTVGDMELKRIILQAAQRNAFYQQIRTDVWDWPHLISQSQIDWVDNGANHWSGDFLYFLGSALGKDLAEVPPVRDVIEDSIVMALADGSTSLQIPTAIDQALSWFSMGVSGCQKINDFKDWLRKRRAERLGEKVQKDAIGDVLEVAELVGDQLTFQKELWDFVFKTMWQMEVVDEYREELSFVLAHTSSDTRAAVNHLLMCDMDELRTMVALKVAQHIGETSIDLIRKTVFDVIKTNPYGKAVLMAFDMFYFIADFTHWDDVHADCHIALDQQVAESNFYHAWNAAFGSLPAEYVTPYDLALVATCAKLWYSTAGDFYYTLALAGDIVEHWPTANSASWSGVVSSWRSYAGSLHASAASLIPERGPSTNNDILVLFPLIRQTLANQPAYVQIGAYSPVALLVTGADGKRIGYDPQTGRIVNDFFPDGSYSGPQAEPQFVRIPAYVGNLTIQAFSTGNGTFRIEVETLDSDNQTLSGTVFTGTAAQGFYQTFDVAVDAIGSVMPADDTLPVITVTGVESDHCYTLPVTPVVSATDADNDPLSLTVTLNGQPYSGNPVADEGKYVLFVRASDGVNVVFETLSFAIDLTAPQITVSGFDNGSVYNRAIQPVINVIDDNLASADISMDGGSFPLGLVEDEGVHVISVVATDGAGHQTSATFNFIIDKTAPQITIDNPKQDNYYNQDQALTYTVTDNLSTPTVSGPASGTAYGEGEYTITLSATDQVGNSASAQLHFIIDKTPPQIEIAGVEDGKHYKEDVASSIVITEAHPATQTIKLNGLDWVPTILSNEGEYTLFVSATDLAGNVSEKTVSFVIDKTALQVVIAGVENGGIYNTNKAATISVTDNHLKIQTVLLDGSHYASGTLLTQEGTHTLSASAQDLAENTSSTTISFMIDKTSPTMILNTPVRDYTQAEQLQISFDASDNLTGLSSVSALFDGVSISNGEVINLFYSSLGNHTLTIVAEDNISNVSILIQPFNVVSTFDSLLQIINKCYQQGLIDNKGIANSLIQKVEQAKKKADQGKSIPAANILQAFVNEVKAQSGKHIASWAANLLISNAQYLLKQMYNQASSKAYSFAVSVGQDNRVSIQQQAINLCFAKKCADCDFYVSVTPPEELPPLPPDLQSLGVFFEITAFDPVQGRELTDFVIPVEINVNVAGQQLTGQTIALYYYDVSIQAWKKLEGKVDLATGTLTASTTHFTLFALFGEPQKETAGQVTTRPVLSSGGRQELPRTGFSIIWWFILTLGLILSGIKLRIFNS